MTEWEAKQRLGVPTPRERLTHTRDDAAGFASFIGGPVVAKASGLAHKTEAGAVRFGLDPEGVARVWEELAALGDGSVLVAEQVRGELELIVGGVRDPQFGPVVSVGLGGIAAEAFEDAVFVLAPTEPGELDRALGGLRSASLLNGWRGSPPVDRAALGDIVDAVGRLLEEDDSVVEVDCNPVLVSGGKPLVLDALVVRR
jgi:acetate---CoA ligase (ADP-forming) subunit beta